MRTQRIFQKVLVFSLAAGLVMSSPRVWAEDETAQLRQQVQELQTRVNQLENQLGNQPLAVTWEDPFAQMMLMQQQVDRNMRQTFAGTGMFNPKMDMRQTANQYVITMDIPGMDKDKINVETKQGMLIVSGERQSETKNDKNNQNDQYHYYRQERTFGSFMQAIPLPEDAKTDQIEANYKNGVLTVTVARENKGTNRPQGQKITVR